MPSDATYKRFQEIALATVTKWQALQKEALKGDMEDMMPIFIVGGHEKGELEWWGASDMPHTATLRESWAFAHAMSAGARLKFKPAAFCISTVLWASHGTPEDLLKNGEAKIPPSEHPERREIVMLMCGTLAGEWALHIAPVLRRYGKWAGLGDFSSNFGVTESRLLKAFRTGLTMGLSIHA